MGKYKSYIFLGITVLILLLVGYCVAKNSKGKTEENEVIKPVEEKIDTIIKKPEQNNNNSNLKANTVFENNQAVDFNNQKNKKNKSYKNSININESGQEDVKIDIKGGLKFDGNTISWPSELVRANSLILRLISKSGSKRDINVTSEAEYLFNPGNKEAGFYSVELIVNDEKFNLKNKLFNPNFKFQCSE